MKIIASHELFKENSKTSYSIHAENAEEEGLIMNALSWLKDRSEHRPEKSLNTFQNLPEE